MNSFVKNGFTSNYKIQNVHEMLEQIVKYHHPTKHLLVNILNQIWLNNAILSKVIPLTSMTLEGCDFA